MDLKRLLSLTGLILIGYFGLVLTVSKNKKAAVIEEEFFESGGKIISKSKKVMWPSRQVASTGAPEIETPTPMIAPAITESEYAREEPSPESYSSGGAVSPGSYPEGPDDEEGSEASGSSYSSAGSTSTPSMSTSSPTQLPTAPNSGVAGSMAMSNVGYPSSQTPKKTMPTPTPSASTPRAATPAATSHEAPNCTASEGNGSFSAPISVSLSCSTSSRIKYCLSVGSCCDPTLGSSYSAPIDIAHVGNVCLSFIGTSDANAVSSSVVNKSYTFNPALPDLSVQHPKIYFQTTELRGQVSGNHLSVSSLDFGKNEYFMEVINLKTHDPGPSGLHLTCEDIAEDYATLNSPVPMVAIADRDTSPYAPSSLLNISLNLTNLVYGNNFLTTLLRNEAFEEKLYACSTTKVTLYDFPYFEATPNQGLAGTNQVREFSGGFTHLGFFEPQTTVSRGPAGSSTQEVATQELRTGSFSVFY